MDRLQRKDFWGKCSEANERNRKNDGDNDKQHLCLGWRLVDTSVAQMIKVFK